MCGGGKGVPTTKTSECNVTCMEGGMLYPEETTVARQRPGKLPCDKYCTLNNARSLRTLGGWAAVAILKLGLRKDTSVKEIEDVWALDA
jgi:hypothetical protein